MDLTGCSFYKYVHPCDQEELAQQLGGQVPLEDMEIFDGLFCTDLPSVLKENERKPACRKLHNDSDASRSFFIRMKSTLTSRGKSVNLSASIYRVIISHTCHLLAKFCLLTQAYTLLDLFTWVFYCLIKKLILPSEEDL